AAVDPEHRIRPQGKVRAVAAGAHPGQQYGQGFGRRDTFGHGWSPGTWRHLSRPDERSAFVCRSAAGVGKMPASSGAHLQAHRHPPPSHGPRHGHWTGFCPTGTTMPDSTSIHALMGHDEFIGRHIGPDDRQIEPMLATLGASSLDELMDRVSTETSRHADALDLHVRVADQEALARLRPIARRNRIVTSRSGTGPRPTHTPHVMLRYVPENPRWYAAYTPYQPQ